MKKFDRNKFLVLLLSLSFGWNAFADTRLREGLDYVMMKKERRVMEELSVWRTPSNEGIPMGPVTLDAVYRSSAYTIGEEITRAHKKATSQMARGPRIQFLKDKAFEIVQDSGDRPDESFIRVILNRCVDVYNIPLQYSGDNIDEIQRFVANFWVKCYEMAAEYANKRIAISDHKLQPNHVEDIVNRYRREQYEQYLDENGQGYNVVESYLKEYEDFVPADPMRVVSRSAVRFGRDFAVRLFTFSGTAVSKGAQSLMLIQLVNYLGYDVQNDLRYRHRSRRQTLVAIEDLQKSNVWERIYGQLDAGQEPSQQDLAILRDDIHTLLFIDMPDFMEDDL